MNHHPLPPAEAQAVLRRHAHDLRNMLCCIDLGIACLLEDPDSVHNGGPEKLLRQLALTEDLVRSLAVRFRGPARDTAAAADIFAGWRHQQSQVCQGDPVRWEEPSSRACLLVDSGAIVTVLSEICLASRSPGGIAAGMVERQDGVCFTISESSTAEAYRAGRPQAQQWKEWRRLVRLSGGRIARRYDAADGRTVTTLQFPVRGNQSAPSPKAAAPRISRADPFDEVDHAA